MPIAMGVCGPPTATPLAVRLDLAEEHRNLPEAEERLSERVEAHASLIPGHHRLEEVLPVDEGQLPHLDVEESRRTHRALRLAQRRAPGTRPQLVGEQDLLTPPWQSRAVAEAIPGARFELVTGPGSSHGMHIERPDDLIRIVTGFLNDHKMQH